MDKVHLGICITDEQGYYVAVNQEYCKIYDYKKEELLGQHFTLIVPKANHERAIKNYKSVMDGTTQNVPAERKLLQKNGAIIDVEFYPQIIENEAGDKFQLNSVRNISDFKNYQELLWRMQDSAQVGGWELDLSTGINQWREHIYKIYEVPEDFEVTPENGMRFYDPEHIPILQQAFHEALTEGKPFDLELKFIAYTGNRKWVLATCNPIMGANKVQALSGTFQDITKRKFEELELEKLSLLSKYTINGVLITDKSAVVEWVNDAFTKETGYTLAEVKGKKPKDFLQGEESDKETIKRMGKKLSQWLPFTETIVNYKKNGKKFWNQLDIIPIIENNWIKNWVAIQTNVTKRKEAENQLLFQANILKNVKDSVIVTDLEGNITYANQGAIKLYGYTYDELLKMQHHELISDSSSLMTNFHSVDTNHDSSKSRIIRQLHTKQNQKLSIEFEVSLLYNTENKHIGYIEISCDVTHRHEREKYISKITQRLELATNSAKLGI